MSLSNRTTEKNYRPANYLQHGSKRPIHVLRHGLPIKYLNMYPYETNRRTAILDGVTVRAQRLNAFSRQLNEFTTTRKRVKTLVSSINGKTKTTGWRFKTSAAKRGSMPKQVSTLPERGQAMS